MITTKRMPTGRGKKLFTLDVTYIYN